MNKTELRKQTDNINEYFKLIPILLETTRVDINTFQQAEEKAKILERAMYNEGFTVPNDWQNQLTILVEGLSFFDQAITQGSCLAYARIHSSSNIIEKKGEITIVALTASRKLAENGVVSLPAGICFAHGYKAMIEYITYLSSRAIRRS